jgi:hypothetical protein
LFGVFFFEIGLKNVLWFFFVHKNEQKKYVFFLELVSLFFSLFTLVNGKMYFFLCQSSVAKKKGKRKDTYHRQRCKIRKKERERFLKEENDHIVG